MTIDINLASNDDRFGRVDENRGLVYPSRDVFGDPIPVRAAVTVHWVNDRFLCFPPHFDMDSVEIVSVTGGDGLTGVLVLSKESVSHPEYENSAQADISPDDVEDELIAPKSSKPKGKH